jgi:L-ascorbate metabolism protein UlaG (beta-lactamase superfamily)
MKFSLFAFAALAVLFFAYINGAKFGSIPRGKRLLRIQKSPNYRGGYFQNVRGVANVSSSGFRIWKEFFKAIGRVIGNQRNVDRGIQSVKTDLIALEKSENVLVWFGHSSYFIQLNGKRFAVDPVMSEISSPVPFCPKAFRGTSVYTACDIPELDYLIISHDHWDHLDYATVLQLKTDRIICPLGVGAHFERWKFDRSGIVEMDWNENISLPCGIVIDCLPAQHFSGRGFRSNRSLWASFMVTAPNLRIYAGGDGGYGEHFREIGNRFHGINLAILENGQYDEKWRNMHMFPEDTANAADDLGAKWLLPVHNSKFALSTHAWDEPRNRLSKICTGRNFNLLLPIIGEKINLDDLI